MSDMTIKCIDGDEWYPVYGFSEVGFALELTDDEVAQIEDAAEAFDKAQELISQRLREQGAFSPTGMRQGDWYAKPTEPESIEGRN